MLQKSFITTLLFGFIFFGQSAYALTSDSGKIRGIYVDAAGNLAIQLDGGFPNSYAAGECPTNNGWAGITSTDKTIKAQLLAAKAAGSKTTIQSSGCVKDGAWLSIWAVYWW